MRSIWVALSAGIFALFGLPGPDSARAAVLSVGTSNQTFGGYVCADVPGGSLIPFTPVNAFDCNAEPNQQFELVPVTFSEPQGPTITAFTIYAMGGHRCLGLHGGVSLKGTIASIAPGTQVESQLCKGTTGQIWSYDEGAILPAVLAVSGNNNPLCLDATTMANGTQLVVNPCVSFPSIPSQNWQIK